MKLSYYQDTDSLYIHLVDRPGVEADEVVPGIVVDFDADRKPVGIDYRTCKECNRFNNP